MEAAKDLQPLQRHNRSHRSLVTSVVIGNAIQG
jgi:hypothetical protein